MFNILNKKQYVISNEPAYLAGRSSSEKSYNYKRFPPSVEMTKRKKFILFKYFFITFLLLAGCKNPFSPSYSGDKSSSSFAISDLKKPEGVFQNIQYAYTFKDTIIYGQLISSDFIFTYRDYEQSVDVSWGRDTEMRATYGLFQNTQQVDLIWNSILLSTVDSTTATYVRGYNLTVTFNPTDIQRYDGRVNLTLRKNPTTEKWAIVKWVDESNF